MSMNPNTVNERFVKKEKKKREKKKGKNSKSSTSHTPKRWLGQKRASRWTKAVHAKVRDTKSVS